MGYDLSRWAKNLNHPCLMPRTRQVLVAICMVAHDEHGEFWMRGQKFLNEHVPDMSYGAYRNHLSILVKNGLLLKVEHGGGRTAHGRGTTTRYRVDSPAVKHPHPDQGVLPDITRSPQSQPSNPQVSEEQPSFSAAEVHQHVDELLADGVTTEQIVEILRSARATLTSSRNLSDGVIDSRNLSAHLTGFENDMAHDEKHVSRNMSDSVADSRNLSADVTGFDEIEEQESKTAGGNMSDDVTDFKKPVSSPDTHSLHEEKCLEEKKDHAAAANLSDLPDDDLTGFFDVLVTALAKAGHPGIRAAQFADLTSFLPDYANLTGSPPDHRTADYIVGRVSETVGIRNVAAFVRRLARDVLTTGEGYVAREAAPAPPSERPAEPSPPPDWNLLHLAHGEQMFSAQKIWDTVLERLRSQVSKPAFETWLSEASGAAYAEGKFVVGTANSFTAEMLRNRLQSFIERAVREVAGVELQIEYAVVASDDRRECPLCQAEESEVS